MKPSWTYPPFPLVTDQVGRMSVTNSALNSAQTENNNINIRIIIILIIILNENNNNTNNRRAT